MAEINDILAQRKAELAARRGALSVLKRQELERLLNKGVDECSPSSVIPTRSAEQPAPLSFAQERLWFLDQLEPESTAYNICIPLRITGRLNLAALDQTINDVVRRHESLRTVFEAVDGRPVQVITAAKNSERLVVDLVALAQSRRDDVVRRLVQEGYRRPFDLAHGPLLQTALVRLASDEHVLLVLLHHIIFDEWSMEILIREFREIYQALDQGEPSPLPDLPIQYADFAQWHRQWLRGEVLEEELSYWRKQLAGSPPMLNLPIDRPRPSVMTYAGDTLPMVISAELTEKLKGLARSTGSSLFMTLLASFQMLLARYTGQDDIVVGTPVAGRRWLETENLIGFFLNTLLIRTRLSGDHSLRDVVSSVREGVLEAQAHQDLPFEKLVEELHPERSLSHGPMFEVMFVFQNMPRTLMAVQDVNIGLLEVNSGTEKFGLTLQVSEGRDELNCSLSYRTDLFDKSTIERLSAHWQRMLEAMVADSDRLLSNVELLNEAERTQILQQWNETTTEWTPASLLNLFESQVERTPNAPAVQFAEQQVSYRELSGRANQLSHYLRHLGVGADTRVAICLEPGLEMVTSVLGVLKAGSAYVPLDPAYPAERLSFMLADARCAVLLTSKSLAARFPETSATVLYVDKDWQQVASESDTNPETQIESANLAYVIYTSGSTGQPKGVAMTHQALSNLLNWQGAELPAAARTLQFASLSFDVSFQEMFSTWCSGGTLVLVTNDLRRDARAMLNFLNAEQIERVFVPFVYLQHLAEAHAEGGPTPANLRDIISAGEQLECTPQIKEFCQRVQCRLHNHYGPSETHVVTALELNGEPAQWPTLPSIGRPIANTQIYILDHALQPVPIGVAGELFIGGAHVSRGYLYRPELTAVKFVPNGFSSVPGERLYRTGDLARYLRGTIEFLGRIDGQVKIQGFRIELGEIEATLRKHPHVLHAVVVDHEDTSRDKRLVAYVVGSGETLSIKELTSYLRDQLPAYMVPAAWIILDALPLTPSGKINRSALPAPDKQRDAGAASFAAPQTLVEEVLAAIWEQVLNLERIGRHDNFFWLGGHSLLGTRIISRIRDSFHVELPVRSLFELPSIAELAARIEELTQSGSSLAAPPLQRRNERLTLSYGQQRLWFLDQLSPGSNAYNLPVAMHISANFNVIALEQSLQEVVRRHEVLRTTFAVTDGEPRPIVKSHESVKLSLVDLSCFGGDEQDSEAARLRQEDGLRPFDLTTGPLLRVTLVRFSKERYLLLANMHHIVSDGWSMEVLLSEMETLYETFSTGAPSPLRPLEFQYADYAEWQRDWLKGEVLQEEVEYWKKQLEGAPTVLELETAHIPSATRTTEAAYCAVVLPEALSRSLRDFSRRQGATLFMTLMAGLHALLQRYTAQTDILVGTPIAGRGRAELEALIGFFVNMVVVRTNFDETPSFKDLLKQVREAALSAYAHQDVPFEKLVEEIKPERALGRNPIFQVVFALQNIEQSTWNLPGVSPMTGVPASPETKFDLEVYLQDGPGGVTGSFVYSPELFEPAFIGHMVHHFQRLLEKAMAEPDAELSTFSLLDEAEYRQVVEEWNDTAVPLPEACIHQLFEEQAAQRPDAVAVEFEQENLSYRELNGRANALAQRLRREGVGPEVFVGVMLERSAELIVGLLGVAKAGGVYVPINLSDPASRIRFILENAGVKVLLTSKQIGAGLSESEVRLIYVDEVAEGESAESPASGVTPDNLAYLMYTSGSTGTPKGVGITHRNILRLVKRANYAEFNADEIFMQFAPVSFDASTFEIWGSLLNGARLIVFPPFTPSLLQLADFVEKKQVTTLWLTGGLFHQMVDANTGRLRTLKQLLAGGEALSPVHVSKAHQQLNGCRLINGYGPTEATTFACYYEIGADFSAPSVPIGRPISNTTAYVLNAMHLAGVGERGELFIGGSGLGRGYHNRPDLTAEKFLPDPYGTTPGARLYRTGDAARYLDQGIIRFLGRVDNQLKMSGFRIEPDEIEAVLAQHPVVSKALIQARELSSGDKYLVAYVVANGGTAPTGEELKDYLKERLPSYMVPSAWVLLDEFPLTPNGKIDRAALPDPDKTRVDSRSIFLTPRTQTEEIMATIWQGVLGLEWIGRDDDFFSLGGYSLLATRIISRIRESFHVELPLRSIFESPTLAGLSQRVEETMRDGGTLPAPPLLRVTGLDQLPLSYAQQRLWFLDQLMPNNNAYNIPIGFRLNGAINLVTLEQSLNEIVQRHESLRTNFVNVDGQPVQVIAPARLQDLPLIDLERFTPRERELLVQRLAHEESQRPFNLSRDSLFRTTLFRLSEQEHVLLVVMHHIISDGWSIEVLIRDVPLIYAALCQGASADLPELPVQYADYAYWQRQWLQGKVLDEELAYWRNQLEGTPPVLNLPTDRPRPSALSLKGSAVTLEVPGWLTNELRKLSQSEGSTLFITLLASFQMLLARYSAQDDISVGTPVAGRRWVQTEDLIGFFVNTLVMRARLSGNPSVREVLHRVREVALEAQAHQDVPFEKLVEELQPQRTLSHGPLFQVMFVFQNVFRPLMTQGDLVFSTLELAHGTEKNDLTLQVIEEQNRLFCSLSYSTDLFDESTIKQFTTHWLRMLEAIVANPEQSLREVELLSAAERYQMLEEWNATEREYPQSICVHELFENQVERTPDAIAVSFEDQRLSYAELDRRTNQLAHYLRRAGVGPETTVALYLERSIDMIVALLGVLKAGGAYLPLETTHPKGRAQYMLEDAGVRVILATSKTATMLPEHRARVISLDSDWNLIAQEPQEPPVTITTADNLAYVIYTSGSTGGARGVMVEHRSLVNLATALREHIYFPHDGALRISLNAPLMFDSSVKQLLQLLYGHELCVIPEEMRADGDLLLAYLKDHEIDLLDCTPSQLRLLLASGLCHTDASAPAMVLAGGEAIDEESWNQFAASKQTTFFNVYGPTECTVDATACRIDQSYAEPSIGRPLNNVRTYLLDANSRPVPLKVHAELFIGGAGVARGYLAEPDLTAERFVPDPFSGKPGARLYRSGDLVRYRRDGRIDFLGRLDNQVKIRGHRIEPGEAEAALRKDPQVREAIVLDRDERPGDKHLVAYIVPEQATISLAELQKNLRDQLPDYMMPTGWVLLDHIPLTPNGKVDRAALPDPARTRLDTGQTFVAPPTLVEEALASIWKQVLDLEEITRGDNFFWLGGHSLLATQIVSRIRESFQVELPVRALFESPRLLELSERIETLMQTGTSVAAPAIEPRPREEHIPLSYAQQRLWFLNQLMPGSNAYNLPAEMLIDSELNVGALEQSLNEVLRRHESLRTTFALVSGQPEQRIHKPISLKLPVVDLRGLDAEERATFAERLRQEAALKPFDLEAGPLLRAMLVVLDERESLFLLNMHHTVSDGWSMGVLLHELETLYESYSKGSPSSLNELAVQYADYAQWQRNWLQGDVLKEEVNYWRRQLEGAPTLLELETDHPRQFLRPLRGAHHPVAFSEEVSQQLREFHRQEGATLFMTLMAGFHALLWRYTGQTDILVGTPVAGRSRVELESMIGFFVNMIPVRTNFSNVPTFRQLVQQVRDAALAGYMHQELPFDKLVEELQPKRSPGRNPIFQAILAFQNAAPQMSLAKVSMPAGIPVSADVKFDLEVHLQDKPGGVIGSFVYSPELFEPAFIGRMVYHFQRLLEKAMAEPDAELCTLSLLDEAEYRQVVEEWNDTAVPLPEACIHQLFEEQAAKRPDAVAVEFEQENLSYRELNGRANALAQRLRREGVGPEVFVGVMLERSAELIVGLLGVAKAGGVYVPINLSDPASRIRFILENAGVKVLLTSKQIGAGLSESEVRLIYVDEVAEGESAESPASGVTPDNLAYLMYTSGSTGTPKGVGITHRNIQGLVKEANYAEFNADEIFMQFAPVSFDASTFEIWACLLNGGRLMIFPPFMPSLLELGEFITRSQVTTLFLTTGLFHQFIDTNVQNIGAVKQLLTGGDALSPAHLKKGLELIQDSSIVNCYGPTESTVMACCYPVDRDRPATTVPIGRPISNARLYIINAMQPTGIGERGELFIGGRGVGRGYHNRPDLTAERFLPDSYGPEPGARLYRTGDAARYLNQGLVQFLGRLDNQVKISGYRIELAEVEAVLSEHPALKEVLVVAREDKPGDKRLVAYVVGNGDATPSNEELRNYLRERLPEYMVPSVCIPLESFPLTQHGKIDRAALPTPQLSLSISNKEYVAPRNGLQQQLVDIWEELFKLHPIGVTHDFFELGGHSLMMVMLMARVEERLGKRVSMEALFMEPTIEHLAELIGHGKENLFQSLVVPMQPHGINAPIFGPHASGGNVWCYTDLVKYIGEDQPFYGIQAREPETGLVVHTEITAMASDYVEAIRSVQPTGPYLLAGWSMGGVIAYEMASQLQKQGERIALLALFDATAPAGAQTEFKWSVLLSIFAFDLGLTYENLSKPIDEIAKLPQMAQLRAVWLEAKLAGRIPSDMTLVEFRKMFDLFKINANTTRTYQPGEFYGRIALFNAEEDEQHYLFSNDPGYYESQEKHSDDPLKGWGDLATEGVDLHVVPGDHFSMMRAPHVSVLAEQLQNCIQEAFDLSRF
jgi:amino acid adenylation domain-containing protein